MNNKYGQLSKLLLIGIALPLIYGCGKELSRSEAKEKIIAKYQLPVEESRRFSLREVGDYANYDLYTEDSFGTPAGFKAYKRKVPKNQSELYTTLEKEGFITIKKVVEVQYGNVGSGWHKTIEVFEYIIYNATYTDKAKPYIVGDKVKICTTEFGEITGIVENKEQNIAEVEYTLKITNITPFGYAYNLREEILNKSITFKKYDDGWRIN